MKLMHLLNESIHEHPYKLGDVCVFRIKNVPRSEWIGYKFKTEIAPYDEKKCKIVEIEDATSKNPSSNFYSIKFADGYVMKGISGYQLDKVG